MCKKYLSDLVIRYLSSHAAPIFRQPSVKKKPFSTTTKNQEVSRTVKMAKGYPWLTDDRTFLPLLIHPISSLILITSTIPSMESSFTALQIASATWSTWIGGTVRAFAIDARGDGSKSVASSFTPGLEVADANERNTLLGVGIPLRAFLCNTEDKSNAVAIGVVKGQKCEWYTRPVYELERFPLIS